MADNNIKNSDNSDDGNANANANTGMAEPLFK